MSKTSNHPLLFARFPSLNGVRAVTLAWVIFVHLPGMAVPALMEEAHNRWRFGVDFFFAISGFLVTRSLYQCFTGRNGVTPSTHDGTVEYITRRLARILPPYYLILAFLAAMGLALRGGLLESLKEISAILPSFPLLFANYMIPVSTHEVPKTLEILWSVSFQEQFYLLLLLAFVAAPKHLGKTLTVMAIASITMRLALAFGPWQGLERTGHYEFWLHLNFDAIAWGCLAWIHYDRLGALWATPTRARWTMIGILAGNALAITLPSLWDSLTAYPVSSVLKGPMFALTVRWICEMEKSNGFVTRFLRRDWLGSIGNASYEIYLVHVIVFGLLEKFGIQSMIPFLVLAYGTSVAAGMLMFHVFSMRAQTAVKKALRYLLKATPSKPAAAASV